MLSLALTLLCLGEYWSSPIAVRAYDRRPSEAHAWLAQQPPGSVTLELPAPTGPTLWLYETEYEVRSIAHWQPLVNGYSAFPPEQYVRLINELPRFPERDVILRLRAIGVKYILINRRRYTAEAFERVMSAAAASSRLNQVRTFGSGDSRVAVFELNYLPES
jgi:hypothetical protein